MRDCYNCECPVRPQDGLCGAYSLCERFLPTPVKVVTTNKTEALDEPLATNTTKGENYGDV